MSTPPDSTPSNNNALLNSLIIISAVGLGCFWIWQPKTPPATVKPAPTDISRRKPAPTKSTAVSVISTETNIPVSSPGWKTAGFYNSTLNDVLKPGQAPAAIEEPQQTAPPSFDSGAWPQ